MSARIASKPDAPRRIGPVALVRDHGRRHSIDGEQGILFRRDTDTDVAER